MIEQDLFRCRQAPGDGEELISGKLQYDRIDSGTCLVPELHPALHQVLGFVVPYAIPGGDAHLFQVIDRELRDRQTYHAVSMQSRSEVTLRDPGQLMKDGCSEEGCEADLDVDALFEPTFGLGFHQPVGG